MEDWRKSVTSWDERMHYIYDNNYLTDLTVKVSDGKTSRSFNAHRLILSMSSDVLEEELRAECLRVPGEAVLNITAANPVAFEQFLRFIYCKQVQIKTIREASDVIKVSIKFNIGDLTRICLEFVEKNLNIHTFKECSEFARMYNLRFLRSRCCDMLRRNTRLILNDQTIGSWNMEALMDVLDQPALQIREIELFYLIEKWIKSKNYNDQSFRKKVRDSLIPKLCFLGMTAEEFTTGPLPSGLLEKNESLAILGHLVADNCDVSYPEGFTQEVRNMFVDDMMGSTDTKTSLLADVDSDFDSSMVSTTTRASFGTRMSKKDHVSFIPGHPKREDIAEEVHSQAGFSPPKGQVKKASLSPSKSILKGPQTTTKYKMGRPTKNPLQPKDNKTDPGSTTQEKLNSAENEPNNTGKQRGTKIGNKESIQK